MDADSHPDPLHDAAQEGLRHAVELTYAAGVGGQVYLQHRRAQALAAAERDERVRRALNAQTRAARDAARASWSPALDPAWIGQADLLQAARAWGAAVPYADLSVPWYEPAAAAAMRSCEQRLRVLHPYAMNRYDRLRSDGTEPAAAMREAAPLFTRPSHTRDGSFTPHPALETGNRAAPSRAADRGEPTAGLVGAEQNRAAAAEGVRAADLDAAADLTATPTVDERAQNLAAAGAAATATAAAARAARSRRPWERDFPLPIHAVVAAFGSRPTRARLPAAGPHVAARTAARGPRP